MTTTEKEKEKIIELDEKGVSRQDIAQIVSRAQPTIRKYADDKKKDDPKKQNRQKTLNESWMTKLFWEDWEGDIDLIQLFFDYNQLANKTGRDLDDFLKVIYNIISQYYRYSDTPIKLFDIFMDISSNMTFLEDGYDVEEFTTIFEEFYDECIFIKDLKKEYGSIEEFKEAKEEEIQEIKKKYDSRFDKLAKIANELKEINQDLVIRTETLLTNQKKYYKKKIKKLIHPLKMEELKLENYALNQVLKEFEQLYPKEVKQYIKTCKQAESQEPPPPIKESEQLKQENLTMQKNRSPRFKVYESEKIIENEKL